MSRRNRPLTPKAIAKRIADGFGQGRGGAYKPWHIVQRTASRGVSYRLPGWTDERVAHTLSALEKRYFLILDWSTRVTEVREQYALPLEETLAIAAELGIDHARERRTPEKTPVPLSTDFLLTVQTLSGPVLVARTVKYAADLSDGRIIEQFEIERVYWERKGVRWGIVTERDFPSRSGPRLMTVALPQSR